MTKTHRTIILVALLLLSLWMIKSYRDIFSASMTAMPTQQTFTPALPLPTAKLSALLEPKPDMLSLLASYKVWGVPKPKESVPDAPKDLVSFTATSLNASKNGSLYRICVEAACYEFIGIMNKQAIFYDTNISSAKKTILLTKSQTLHEPLKVEQLSVKGVTLKNTKTQEEYAIPMFHIDIENYKPKSKN